MIIVDAKCNNSSVVMTNIVIFELAPDTLTPSELVQSLVARGVKIGAIGGRKFRAVTHYGIEAEDIEYVLASFQTILSP